MVGNFISMKKGVLEKINKIKIMAMIKIEYILFLDCLQTG